MNIAYMMTGYAGGGQGAVAYLSPDQEPEQYQKRLDAGATIDALQRAISALEGGDSTEAVKASGEAWFRIAAFHKS